MKLENLSLNKLLVILQKIKFSYYYNHTENLKWKLNVNDHKLITSLCIFLERIRKWMF